MLESLKIFKALSDETRLKILSELVDGEKCVCEIVPKTGRTQSTVSIQLNKLENMGILRSRREGKSVYYKISNDRVRRLTSEEFSKWMGLERDKIEWFPQIDIKKCNGCGLCILGCSRDVFELANEVPVVKYPLRCRVGCEICGTYCLQNAISFPDKEYVRRLIRENNLFDWSKKQLSKGGDLK